MMKDLSVRLASILWLSVFAGFAAEPVAGEEIARLGETDLQIEISGVRSGQGVIQYAVFDSAEHFPSREGRVAKGEVAAISPKTIIVVRGLKPGTYAVAVFHDENLNDDFDQGFLGIPLEDYGFSNDARGLFAAPDFEDARFPVVGPRTRISITIGR